MLVNNNLYTNYCVSSQGVFERMIFVKIMSQFVARQLLCACVKWGCFQSKIFQSFSKKWVWWP